ncbi:MAG: hypothetical protein EBS51_14010, partial [Planctomycetia bacterium]|nr:hypothetical protein [Planctomycetia bacterium]
MVIAKATDGTRREATVGDGVDLSDVGSLGLFAASSPIVKAHSIAVDVGGVAVTVNQSVVTTNGKAKAATGTGVTLPLGDVQIMASGSSRLDAGQTGAVAGLLAAGATQTTGESGLATEAVLGADTRTAAGRTGSLVVRATSQDVTTIAATAGSGGLFAGFGTTGDLRDATTTRATMLGGTIHAGTVDVGVDRLNRYDLDVNSVTITIAAGVGITRATFTADQTAADGIDRVRVGIGAGTVVTALDRVTVTAAHRVYRTGTDDTVRGVGGAVLVSGQQAVSKVSVQVPATIDVGDRVAITSGTNALSRPGGITFVPTASLEIEDSAALNNLGLLVSGGHMASYLDGGVTPQVTMGDDVRLVSHGQLNIGTSAFVQSSTAANGWGRGLFGGIGTEATSNVTVDQRVTIGDRAMFASDGSLSMTPGDEPTGGWPTSLSLTATARAADQGIVAVPVAKARTTLSHSSTLSVGRSADISSGGSMYLSGRSADISSGGSMYLSARAAEPVVAATGEAQGDYFGFPATDIDQHAESPTTSTVTLAGRFLAGRENALSLVIPATPSGGFTDTVQATPATVFGVPVASTWRYLPTFDPTAYIDAAGYSPEVASALKAGVAPGTVGAVSFVSPQPIMVSGGSVAITADRIAADGATITARTATISIRNDSSDYLLLGDLAIANVEGGRVTFQNGGGHAVADPQGARVYRDDAATPTIRVDVTSTTPVGDSTYGPAVFLAGHVENLGGDVTIRNASGSFGQTGTIAANRITIETPNGVFAVDTPNDPWNAAGTPAAQAALAGAIMWPGGDPRLGRADANQGVMYAINAMDAPAGTSDRGWKSAGNDDTLNAWVYGDPRAVRDSYVFFGGSTPQFENDTNTQATSENWAAGARPDGARQALKMTDAAPPHSRGWDHAWVPRLQALPSTFTTANLPSQSTGVAVTGQVIVINAKIANINGTLEAGGSKPETQSIVIPKSLEPVLREYQSRYRVGTVSAPIYRIRADELETLSPADRLIGASFDARTGQIILDEASSSGAGSVSIKGRIINTDSLAGKIKVRGGSGDLVVTNDTSLPLVTANLQTSRAEKQAVVSIT